MIYTVTFNPALDYIVFLDDMKLGDIKRARRESIFYSHGFYSSVRGKFPYQRDGKTRR